MKILQHILILFLLLIYSSTIISAQDSDWKTISPAEEEFTVEVPSSFYTENQTNYVEDNYVDGDYRSFLNNTYYLISTDKYEDFSFKDVVERYANDNNAKKQNIFLGKINGDLYKFTDSIDFQNVIITVSTTKRIYAFHIVGEILDEEGVDKFIKSIKFDKNTKNGKPPQKPKFEKLTEITTTNAKTVAKLTDNIAKSENVGIGTGFGNGNDSTNSTDNEILTPKRDLIITPLKILSKQKPGYTDLARMYNITGVVRLRVTFLADGKIGDILPLQTLSFGLTKKAINAAKLIKFEPPTQNDVPYTVVKVVVYNFSIY